MRTLNLFKTLPAWLLGACLCMGSASVYAVHDIHVFELDGNAHQQSAADDWSNLYADCGEDPNPDGSATNCGNSEAFTGILEDAAPQTIFTQGGSKDDLDVSNWKWTDGSVPDKDDITNAFAAAYDVDGDLVVYFGADRFANDGDAQMGFWFFENDVYPKPDGTFNEVHSDKDVLALVHWAAGSAPEVQILQWNPAVCPKKTPGNEANLIPGDCGGDNLVILVKEDAQCDGGSGDDYCAIANAGGEPIVWFYVPKQPDPDLPPDTYPELSLFEGGINLSKVLQSDACFSSFLAETRSSTSPTAQLKDFRQGRFPVCGTALRTEIHLKDAHGTDIQGESVSAGSSLHDAAFLSVTGFGTSVLEGTVSFQLYADNDCTEGNEVPEADGGYFERTVPDDGTSVTSELYGDELRFRIPDATYDTGLISFKATFVSSNDLPDAVAACENLTLNALTPSLVTEIHKTVVPEDHSDITFGTVKVGTVIHDEVTVTGSGATPTGDVTFTLYEGDACEGPEGGPLAPVITSFGTNGNGSETVTLVGGVAESPDFDTTGYLTTDASKSLSFRVSYGGSPIYKSGEVADCEPLTIEKYTPVVATEIHSGAPSGTHTFGTGLDIQNRVGFTEDFIIGGTVHDMAQVTGDGPTPTGTVDFKFYSDMSCTSEIVANGTTDATLGSGLAESSGFSTTGYIPTGQNTKILAYKAFYSGNGFYTAASESGCEWLRVVKRLPSITTHVIVTDQALVSGDGSGDPTGTVTYNIYGNSNCEGTATMSTGALLNGIAAVSQSTTISETGGISYIAKYPGDDNYVAVDHACESVDVTLPTATQGTLE